jgi:DNA-binding PadR family transcriptional regulator
MMHRIYAITPSGRTVLVEAKGKIQEYFGELFEAQQ